MQKPKISYPLFLFRELKCFLFEWPAVIFISAIASIIILWTKGNNLSELEKALCGGVVSSFVFYFFIDFLPKISEKRNRLFIFIFVFELEKCIESLNHIFTNIQSEWPEIIFDINSDSKFFRILERQTIQYQPLSNKLKRIKHTIDSNPLKFVYCNLGEVLNDDYERLKKQILYLDRVAAAIQLDSLSITSLLEIGNILDRNSLSNMIHRFPHINNTAALLGTDFDFLFNDLIKIRKRLSKTFKIKYEIASTSA